MVDKELTMTSDEVLDYIKNNFKEFDKVDIAYNRVSAKGDVLGQILTVLFSIIYGFISFCFWILQ